VTCNLLPIGSRYEGVVSTSQKDTTAVQHQRFSNNLTKENEMTKHSFNWLRLGAFAVIAITTGISAMGQACNGAQCTGKIGSLYVTSLNGKPLVYLNFTAPNDMRALNCTLVSSSYATLQSDNPNYDKIFSVLEQSKFLGKTVEARVYEGTNNCAIAYVVATP
jgi:hypothetical protein